jgi:hypothetical protein
MRLLLCQILLLAGRSKHTRNRRDELVDRSAETKDHRLSDAVVELLKTRRPAASQSVNSARNRNAADSLFPRNARKGERSLVEVEPLRHAS